LNVAAANRTTKQKIANFKLVTAWTADGDQRHLVDDQFGAGQAVHFVGLMREGPGQQEWLDTGQGAHFDANLDHLAGVFAAADRLDLFE
jgi:hypothetical protein